LWRCGWTSSASSPASSRSVRPHDLKAVPDEGGPPDSLPAQLHCRAEASGKCVRLPAQRKPRRGRQPCHRRGYPTTYRLYRHGRRRG
jgi:hypothetical protein